MLWWSCTACWLHCEADNRSTRGMRLLPARPLCFLAPAPAPVFRPPSCLPPVTCSASQQFQGLLMASGAQAGCSQARHSRQLSQGVAAGGRGGHACGRLVVVCYESSLLAALLLLCVNVGLCLVQRLQEVP